MITVICTLRFDWMTSNVEVLRMRSQDYSPPEM